MIRTVVLFAVLVTFTAPIQAADQPDEVPVALQRKLHGEWRGGPGRGKLTLRADGTFERQHYSPGNNKLAGTWELRWNALPPSLVLVCQTSDDPDRVGKTSQLKLIELNDNALTYRYPGEQTERYERVTNDEEKGAINHSDEAVSASVEDLNLVKGLVARATMKQVIGYFGSHGRPQVGDTFEIDFDNLPQRMIKLTPQTSGSPYIPFAAPLTIQRVKQVANGKKSGHTRIELSAVDTSGKFLIHVFVENLEKGSEVRIVLYKEVGGGFLPSMAEAEGVLK